jgi:poly(A) polymerase Pap1
MISKVLSDLSFRRNQPLKSVDDQYIRILKNKTKTSDIIHEVKKPRILDLAIKNICNSKQRFVIHMTRFL